jgi:hypothetical protein
MSRAYLGLCCALAAACVAGLALHGCREGGRPAAPPGPRSIPELADLLRERGLRLHLAPTGRDADLSRNGFLTTSPRTFEELNRLQKTLDRAGLWRGVVYCEVNTPQNRSELLQRSGEYALTAGPFVFFGDPELLHDIEAALPPEGPR